MFGFKGLPDCSLNVIGASHNGFQVTGADTCNNTATLNLMVTPHFCSGNDISLPLDSKSLSLCGYITVRLGLLYY